MSTLLSLRRLMHRFEFDTTKFVLTLSCSRFHAGFYYWNLFIRKYLRTLKRFFVWSPIFHLFSAWIFMVHNIYCTQLVITTIYLWWSRWNSSELLIANANRMLRLHLLSTLTTFDERGNKKLFSWISYFWYFICVFLKA